MEAERLILKQFVKIDYKGFGCIKYAIENRELIVFFEHWKYSPWFLAPKVYLGKVKTKNLKPTYVWLD